MVTGKVNIPSMFTSVMDSLERAIFTNNETPTNKKPAI